MVPRGGAKIAPDPPCLFHSLRAELILLNTMQNRGTLEESTHCYFAHVEIEIHFVEGACLESCG